MADMFSWGDLTRWLQTVALRSLPNWLLRWAWSNTKLLGRIEAFPFSSEPKFCVRMDRNNPELLFSGFNVFNFSPFRLTIVGADLRVQLNHRDLLRYEQRFPSEIPMPPFARSGFHFHVALNDAQVTRVRAHPKPCVAIRIDGAMILRTPFGEQRKDLCADVLASIDR